LKVVGNIIGERRNSPLEFDFANKVLSLLEMSAKQIGEFDFILTSRALIKPFF
jgi:hypothetical protein